MARQIGVSVNQYKVKKDVRLFGSLSQQIQREGARQYNNLAPLKVIDKAIGGTIKGVYSNRKQVGQAVSYMMQPTKQERITRELARAKAPVDKSPKAALARYHARQQIPKYDRLAQVRQQPNITEVPNASRALANYSRAAVVSASRSSVNVTEWMNRRRGIPYG